MSIDYDSFYTKKRKKESTEENNLLEDNAKLTLDIKKLRTQCKVLEQRLAEFEAIEFHCGKCSKGIPLDFLKKRSDENRIICPVCAKRTNES